MLEVGTSAGFLPLFAGDLADARARRLVETLEAWGGRVPYLVPSTDPAAPEFEPRRYWRGPVWLVVNWMIADGLGRLGASDLADRIRKDSRALVEQDGFFEYFDPQTGRGLGGGASPGPPRLRSSGCWMRREAGAHRARGSSTRYRRSESRLRPMNTQPTTMVPPSTAFMSALSSELVM